MQKNIIRENERYRVGRQAAHAMRLAALDCCSIDSERAQAIEYYCRLNKIYVTAERLYKVTFTAALEEKLRQSEELAERRVKAYSTIRSYVEQYHRECG